MISITDEMVRQATQRFQAKHHRQPTTRELAQEIRTHLNQTLTPQRKKFMAEVAKACDADFQSIAIEGAPRNLSGVCRMPGESPNPDTDQEGPNDSA